MQYCIGSTLPHQYLAPLQLHIWFTMVHQQRIRVCQNVNISFGRQYYTMQACMAMLVTLGWQIMICFVGW